MSVYSACGDVTMAIAVTSQLESQFAKNREMQRVGQESLEGPVLGSAKLFQPRHVLVA
jgi:hypothetical protein